MASTSLANHNHFLTPNGLARTPSLAPVVVGASRWRLLRKPWHDPTATIKAPTFMGHYLTLGD